MSNTDEVPQPVTATASDKKLPDRLFIRIWPKTPVLYPMAILALLFAIVSHFLGATPVINDLISEKEGVSAAKVQVEDIRSQLDIPDEQKKKLAQGYRIDRVLALIFLAVLTFSLFVIAVDFEVRWALIVLACILIAALVVYIVDMNTGFLAGFLPFLDRIAPVANPQFYLAIFVVWLLLLGVSALVARFNYVRIESNELIAVGGVMEDHKRYSTFRMHYTKEITDVLEYWLPFVRAGRLVFSFPNEDKPVILDNVLNVDKVLKELDRISSRWNVGGEGS
ncbi:MAG: hypothetical protein AAF555_03575 [Verrucomicrobiota bacterium]